MNSNEAADLVLMLHSVYPQDKNANEIDLSARIDVFAVMFADFDKKTLKKVILNWLSTHKYMPTPQELLELCKLQKKLGHAGFIGEMEITAEQEMEIERICKSLGFGYDSE